MVKQLAPLQEMQVLSTTNYNLFKSLNGNRDLNRLHLQRLISSMKENYLFTLIVVNEKYQIIDGQHRFEACKELGLPLYYVKVKGYGLREVQILNVNAKNWNADDFLAGFCDLGLQDYIAYRDFKAKYGFGHYECQVLLSGETSGGKKEAFYDGTFKVKNLKEAIAIAEKLQEIAPYYAGYNRRSFIYAIIAMLKNPDFVWDEFVKKVILQPMRLVDCTTTNNYRALIEEIYNYRRSKKVNLRY